MLSRLVYLKGMTLGKVKVLQDVCNKEKGHHPSQVSPLGMMSCERQCLHGMHACIDLVLE